MVLQIPHFVEDCPPAVVVEEALGIFRSAIQPAQSEQICLSKHALSVLLCVRMLCIQAGRMGCGLQSVLGLQGVAFSQQIV